MGIGIGMTSASGPPWAKKPASTGPVSSVWKFEWRTSGSKPGGRQAGLPDRHPAAVDDDRDAVGDRSERRRGHARQAAVDQQHPESNT